MALKGTLSDFLYPENLNNLQRKRLQGANNIYFIFCFMFGAFPPPSNWARSVAGKPFFRLPPFLFSPGIFGILFILVLKSFAYHNCLQLDGPGTWENAIIILENIFFAFSFIFNNFSFRLLHRFAHSWPERRPVYLDPRTGLALVAWGPRIGYWMSCRIGGH